MKGFKKCANGHFYKEDTAECPYCEGMKGMKERPNGHLYKEYEEQCPHCQKELFENGDTDDVRFIETYLGSLLISLPNSTINVVYKIYEGRNLIGCDKKCDVILLNDEKISKKHAVIRCRSPHYTITDGCWHGDYILIDKGSTHGTFLNGEKLESEKFYFLLDGDIIQMGETMFKFMEKREYFEDFPKTIIE